MSEERRACNSPSSKIVLHIFYTTTICSIGDYMHIKKSDKNMPSCYYCASLHFPHRPWLGESSVWIYILVSGFILEILLLENLTALTIPLLQWDLYVSILNFFKKEKYFRGLLKFRKSVLISWCRITKYKEPRKLLKLQSN